MEDRPKDEPESAQPPAGPAGPENLAPERVQAVNPWAQPQAARVRPAEDEKPASEVDRWLSERLSGLLGNPGLEWEAKWIVEEAEGFKMGRFRTVAELRSHLAASGNFRDFLFYSRATDPRAATFEYFDRHWPSFARDYYEWIGRLALDERKEYQNIVREVMRLAAGGLLRGGSATAQAFTHQSKNLAAPARGAKAWIRDRWKRMAVVPSRETLWQEYFDAHQQKCLALARQTNPEAGEYDSYFTKQRVERMRAGDGSLTDYLGFGIVPKELFKLLARRARGPLSPSEAVREFLKGRGISSSSATHRENLGKK